MFWIIISVYALGVCALITRIAYANKDDKSSWKYLIGGISCAIFWPIVIVILAILWPLMKFEEQWAARRVLRERDKLLASEKQERLKLAANISEALIAIADNQEEISLVIASLEDYVVKSVSENYCVGLVEDVLTKEAPIDDFAQSYEIALSEFRKKSIYEQLSSGRIVRYHGVVNFSLSTDARAEIPWAVVMTKNFMKSLTKIDKKMKAKLLSAISEISDDPLTARGDTIKPLTHDFKECWRYRIGDFRLIYIPKKDAHEVVILSFSSRGSAYV